MGSLDQGVKHTVQKGLDNSRPWMGIGLLVLSGLGYSSSIIIASILMKRGVGVNTSNAARYLVATVLLLFYQKAGRKQIKILPRERYTALALGITVFIMGIGYLGATRYIPVSTAVLIFYTGPLFTVLISRFTENEPITIIRLMAIATAFMGLSLALGVQSAGSFQVKGVLFAFMAAIGMATFVTISSLAIRTADPQAVNLHTLFSGTLLFILFLCIENDTAPSAITSSNLFGLCGSGCAIAVAYIAFYAGLKIIGPVKASMLMNTEPIFTVALAAAILGEKLSFMKFFGAGLVIIGIVMINCKFARNPIRRRPFFL
jgi:drug/metabolite transporter (DMT)-like permease